MPNSIYIFVNLHTILFVYNNMHDENILLPLKI